MPKLFAAILIFLGFFEFALAKIIDISISGTNIKSSSGLDGDSSVNSLSPRTTGVLYKLEFGYGQNGPCFVRAHFWALDGDNGERSLPWNYNSCALGRVPRQLEVIEARPRERGYTGISEIKTCHDPGRNWIISGVSIERTTGYLHRLVDQIIDVPVSGSSAFRRDNCFQEVFVGSSCENTEIPVGIDLKILSRNAQANGRGLVVGISLICTTPTAEAHSITRGNFTIYPINFLPVHWQYLEPNHPYLAVGSDQTIDVLICRRIFLRPHLFHQDVEKAFSRFTAIQKTRLKFSFRFADCDSVDDTYRGAILREEWLSSDIRIQFDEASCKPNLALPGAPRSFDDKTVAEVCHQKRRGPNPWITGHCRNPEECRADSALVVFNDAFFRSPADMPSVGILAHQIARVFGQRTNYAPIEACETGNSITEFGRPKAFSILPGFAKGSGFALDDTDTYLREDNYMPQYPTAYSVAHLQHRYGVPIAIDGPVRLGRPDWALHQTLDRRSIYCDRPSESIGVNPVTVSSVEPIRSRFATVLCTNDQTQFLVDCNSGLLPEFSVSFSSNDASNCNVNGDLGLPIPTLRVTVSSIHFGTLERVNEPIPLEECGIAYYHWTSSLQIPSVEATSVGGGPSLRFEINRDGRFREINHYEDEVDTTFTIRTTVVRN